MANRQYLNTSFYSTDDHAVPQISSQSDLLNTFLEDDYFQGMGENNAMMIRRTSYELMDTFPTSASMLNLIDAGKHQQQGGDVLNFDSLYPETSELSEGGFSDAVVPQFLNDASDITSMPYTNNACVKKQEREAPFSFFGNASRAMNMSMMTHPTTEAAAAAAGFVPTPMEPVAVVPQMISNRNSNNAPQPSRRRAARPVADPLMMMNTAVNINSNNKRPAEDAEDDMLHGDDDDDYIPSSHRTMSTRRHPEGRMTSGSVGGASGAGGLNGEERELTRKERVARWLEKRKHRNFTKRVRYVSRKAYADVRPRIKGRFVSPEIYAAYMRGEPVMVDGTEVVLPASAVVAAAAAATA
jgi:hypothetical protein